ncbi:hypothetical protein ACX93W_05115 [Paenibacillus sp. CAU 1782]
MLSTKVMKNIQLQEWEDFFRTYNVPRWSVETRGGSSLLRYSKIKTFLQDNLSSETPSFSEEQLDDFIFDKLFYSNSNYHVLYQFNTFFADMGTTIADIEEFAQRNSNLMINASLINWRDNTNLINLCTIRPEFNDDGFMQAFNILLRIDTLDQQYGATNAFCAVTIDLERNFCILRFNQLQFDLTRTELMDIVKVLKATNVEGEVFEPLELNITTFDETDATASIYEMFAELSAEAEAVLDAQVNDETEDKINEFLSEIVAEVKEDYVEQIKNVIYQDITERMEDIQFEKGWIFKFHFRESDYTRASSRNEKRLPIYDVKSFWQLKEIIHNAQSMQEASFHWHLNEVPGDENFVDVRIEYKNGTMIVYYYTKMRVSRREKEEFVLRKIKAYLQ